MRKPQRSALRNFAGLSLGGSQCTMSLWEAQTLMTFGVDEGELHMVGPDLCDEADVIPFAFNDWG